MKEFINYTDFMQKVSAPLFKYLPIGHFCYIEIHANGDFYALSTDRDLYEEYTRRSYTQRTPFHVLLYSIAGMYLNDYYSYPLLSPYGDHNSLLKDFNLGHSCLMMECENGQYGKINKFYCFEGRVGDREINHLYINNLDIIKKFNKYFDRQLAAIRPSLIPQRVPVQLEMMYPFLQEQQGVEVTASRNQLLSALAGAQGHAPTPTSREIEVIEWSLKGKTAEETATIMHISRRTVEKHFEKLKKKFGCYSKSQLALQMAKYLDF